jgi:hypothetical protein
MRNIVEIECPPELLIDRLAATTVEYPKILSLTFAV